MMANLRFGAGSKLMKLLSLVLLILVLLIGGSFLLKHCDRDASPTVPLVQNEEKLETPGIISESGDLLLPVAEVARGNQFQAEIFVVKNEGNLLQQQTIVLLPLNQSASGYTFSYYVDDNHQVSDLTICKGGQLLAFEGEPVLHRNLLYLPAPFFTDAFGLQVELTEDGNAILTPPAASQPTADQQSSPNEGATPAPANNSQQQPAPAAPSATEPEQNAAPQAGQTPKAANLDLSEPSQEPETPQADAGKTQAAPQS